MQPIHRRIIFIFVLIAGLFWIMINADRQGSSTAGLIPAPQQGFLAPEIELQTLDGKSIALADLRGKSVLVNLWATWCPPCRAEMPAIQKLYDKYKDQGFEVLAINATNQDSLSEIAPFVQSYNLTFPVLLDFDGKASRSYQLRSLPSSFLSTEKALFEKLSLVDRWQKLCSKPEFKPF